VRLKHDAADGANSRLKFVVVAIERVALMGNDAEIRPHVVEPVAIDVIHLCAAGGP